MELPKRKPTRLKGYNYSTPGMYFITICTYNKQCILSKIVGEGLRALPQNILTPIGNEIEKSIKYINDNYIGVTIDKYVIMPNHIHLIVVLRPSTCTIYRFQQRLETKLQNHDFQGSYQ